MRVYLITNKVNGKCYVGQTGQTIASRWKRHLRRGQVICHAVKKYGELAFSIEELCTAETQDELNFLEILFMAARNALDPVDGYNQRDGGDVRGGTLSDSTKAKISASLRNLTPEQRKRKSIAATGRVLSLEARKKISIKAKGRVLSPERRKQLREILRRVSHLRWANRNKNSGEVSNCTT